MTLTLVETQCHFCRRREDDLIGRLKALTTGTHVGAYACDEPDREDCLRVAYGRLRRKGRR
jgi:hypothetical protein